ncbi:hypothetical protein Pan216_25810 [Planctomycetes bacterium Pan216]|uniref:DUF1559 domain-containing protein n=1 Tax=Kolteria novifilia TaxID=2527975 RepID=A0A518B410_9BACT|nr:hypothetical protein Pan216_25810 [Planctomycetes bacterium Pan216]
MNNRHGARRAFTLVELLVVIAIIGVLVALLLPAVQQAREAARRSQCLGNLKQFGAALHNYLDAHGVFPPGYIYRGNNNPGWGWGVMLLPHLDQSSLYDRLNVSSEILPASPTPDTTLTLAIFNCPSDTGGPLNTRRGGYAKANYVACIGVRNSIGDALPSGIDELGMFYASSSTRLANVSDGTSKTYAVGERWWSGDASTGKAGGIWPGAYTANRSAGTLGSCYDNQDRRLNGTNDFSYGSLHNGGGFFLLADGSVNFVSDAIDGETYEAFATMGSGEIIQQ